MRNNCPRCSKELGAYDFGLCYDCKYKEEKLAYIVMIGLFVSFILIVFGIRLLWAKIAYDDYRCVFSECRLLKN